MSVALFNDQYVILPHMPDWSSQVEWTRVWQCGVTDAVDGSEARLAVRPKGRHGLRFTVTPYNLQERARLMNRLRAADKSGYAAVPFWGRGIRLAAAQAGSETVTLAVATPWLFDAGDPVFFCLPDADQFDAWEVLALAGLQGATMTLDSPLLRSYPSGWFCWPMILGRLAHGSIDLATDWHASVQIEVRQLDVRPDPVLDLCAIMLSVPGAGDCFDCYAEEDPLLTALGAGNGWMAAWAIHENPLGIRIWDTFDTYLDGEEPTGLNGGHGWTDRWFVSVNPRGIQTCETFDTYPDQDPVSGFLNGGFGWVDPWQLNANPYGTRCAETFDSYPDEDPLDQPLEGGSGWSGAWHVLTAS